MDPAHIIISQKRHKNVVLEFSTLRISPTRCCSGFRGDNIQNTKPLKMVQLDHYAINVRRFLIFSINKLNRNHPVKAQTLCIHLLCRSLSTTCGFHFALTVGGPGVVAGGLAPELKAFVASGRNEYIQVDDRMTTN